MIDDMEQGCCKPDLDKRLLLLSIYVFKCIQCLSSSIINIRSDIGLVISGAGVFSKHASFSICHKFKANTKRLITTKS